MRCVVLVELASLDEGAVAVSPSALEGKVALVDHHVADQMRLPFEGFVAPIPSTFKGTLRKPGVSESRSGRGIEARKTRRIGENWSEYLTATLWGLLPIKQAKKRKITFKPLR